MNKYPVIVIFKEKHGDLFYIANNKEELGKIFLSVFVRRYEEGWYFKPKPVEGEIVKIVDDWPDDLKRDIERRNKLISKKQWDYQRDIKEWKLIQKTYETKDSKMAYQILYMRSDYEYEEMRFEWPIEVK